MLILRIILVKVKNLRSSECQIIPALLVNLYFYRGLNIFIYRLQKPLLIILFFNHLIVSINHSIIAIITKSM